MRRLGWLLLTLVFVSGSAQAAPWSRSRAKHRALTHAKAQRGRATTGALRGAFHRINALHPWSLAKKRLSKLKIKVKQRRELTASLKALDPRLAALTKTLIKAEGRAKTNDPAWAKGISANRMKPAQRAKFQKSIANYIPLSQKQFATSLRNKGVPRAVAKRMVLVDVKYRGYDGKPYQGQIVVHKELEQSIAKVFRRIFEETTFPIGSVIPISDKRFGWSDRSSVAKNNSSGFNFRLVSGSREVSDHAFGTAIDINPDLNPWVKGGTKNKKYNPRIKGTLHKRSHVVKIFEQEGWKWGGRWKNSKDWQHFYRPDIPQRDYGKQEVPE